MFTAPIYSSSTFWLRQNIMMMKILCIQVIFFLKRHIPVYKPLGYSSYFRERVVVVSEVSRGLDPYQTTLDYQHLPLHAKFLAKRNENIQPCKWRLLEGKKRHFQIFFFNKDAVLSVFT
jgi:hypothetical protein